MKKSKPKKTGKKKTTKNNKKRLKIVKWTSLSILVLTAITIFLLSDLFNIKEIKVLDNNKLTGAEIIQLSKIEIDQNMFKFLKIKAIENIKTNPYIETVKIKRKLNGTVEIKVTERVATFMLPIDEEYAYINNQGYILEKNPERLEIPEIIGYTTENLEPGERLDIPDLKKLNFVIQILSSAKEKGLAEKITNINIENDENFIIVMEEEGKTINFGNSKEINDKFVKLTAVLEDTAGEKGEVFLQNIDKVYFRKEV